MCDSLSVWVHNYVIQVKVKVGHILTMFTQHTTSKQYSGHFLGVLCSMLVIGWVGTGDIGTGKCLDLHIHLCTIFLLPLEGP